MPLPLILAGPILRRVEPTLVSVWVALSEPLHVQISLWNGLVKDEGNGLINEDASDTLFHTSQPILLPSGGQPAVDTARTIRIGDRLHIAVVSFKLPPTDALRPNRHYSYNLTFRRQAAGVAKEDLKTLKLLQNDPIDVRPNLALGYEPGFLPSFELPPAELTDLRILHGSCRRLTQRLEDGLSWVDDLIREARLGMPDPLDPAKPLVRPHQLLLTGDQIYADDMALPLLPQLIDRGRELLGDKEFLPTRWPNGTKATYWPADAKHFPPGLRHQFITSEARFTTVDRHSHLMSFGEFAAMYLFYWSNALWDIGSLKRFDDIIGAIAAVPDTWGAMFRRSEERPEDDIGDDLLKRFLKLLFEDLKKAELRRALKDSEFKDPEKERDCESGDQVVRKPLDPGVLTHEKLNRQSDCEREKHRKIYEFALGLSAEDLAKFRGFVKDLQDDLSGMYEPVNSKRKQQVEMLFKTLPKVRRALANVPTYMMLDDHEVTDDWNLNPMWCDRVYTSPLGRTILRNGLLAYALFQGWGNDPEKFERGAYAELLNLASTSFPEGASTPPQEESEAAKKLDLLFGLDGSENPPLKWHYSLKCARHLLVMTDNRTRRSFVSRIGPPGNLAPEALQEQIPAGPLPAGIEVVIVVTPLPVIGPPLFDEVIAPLSYRVFDLKSYIKHGDEELKGMPGTNPDAIEAWAFDPETFEALLKRLEPYRRIVILSGDVHYGSSQFLSYWRKNDAEPARFAQLISSGLRNVMPEFIRFADRSFPLAQRIIRGKIGITRLGWDENSPAPVTLPADGENVMPALRAKLERSPVMIPATGWPEGTAEARPADWKWRAHVNIDNRSEDERPEPSRPAPLPADTRADTVEGYRQIAARHARQFKRMKHGRQVIFTNNLGLIRFEIKENAGVKTLDVIQGLYATHPEAPDPAKAELYTLHRVTLAALDGAKLDEKPPEFGGLE